MTPCGFLQQRSRLYHRLKPAFLLCSSLRPKTHITASRSCTATYRHLLISSHSAAEHGVCTAQTALTATFNVTRNSYFYHQHSLQPAWTFSHFPLSRSMKETDTTITSRLSSPEVQHIKSFYPLHVQSPSAKALKRPMRGHFFERQIDYTGCH